MPDDSKTLLTLSTLCSGKMEAEFQEIYPAILASLKEGTKATISITLELQRAKETTSMVSVGYKLTPRFPARGKASVCQIGGDGKQLFTEKPVEKVKPLALFDGGKGGAVNE